MLSIQEALKQELDTNITIRAMAVRVISSQKTPRYVMKVAIADQSGSTTLTSYNAKLEEKLIGHTGLTICNAINKTNGFVATSRTLIGVTNPFEIPPEVMTELEGDTLTIKTAMGSPAGKLCSLRGKITEILTPPHKKMCHGIQRTFAEVAFQDTTGTATLAMWGQCAENIEASQVLHISNVRVKLFNEEKRLSSTPGSMKEEIRDAELRDLPAVAAEGTAITAPLQGEVLAVMDCDPHYTCHLSACKDQALESRNSEGRIKLFCTGHMDFVATSVANYGLTATLLLSVEDKTVMLKAKLPILEEIMATSIIQDFDKAEITDQLLMKLIGKQFKYSSFRGNITHIF